MLTKEDIQNYEPVIQSTLVGDFELGKSTKPQFCFRTAEVTGAVDIVGQEETVRLGESVEVKVALAKAMAFETGGKFRVRVAGRTAGVGKVLQIIR